MKILHIRWGELGSADIEEAFVAEGHEVVRFPFSKDQDIVHNRDVEERLSAVLHKEIPDVVFSFNFFPVISTVCAKEDIRYISWVFDDSYVFLYSDTTKNTCNHIYVFDKEIYRQLREDGIPTVYFMPLAANIERLDAIDREKRIEYKYDVTFVGSLYIERLNFFDKIYDSLPDYPKGYVHALMAAQLQIQGYNFIEGSLSPVMSDLYRACPLGIEPGNRATREYLYAQYVLNRKITSIERIDFLDTIAKRYPVDLFTYVQGFDVPNITNHGIVRYYDEAPVVFKESRINLNISLRSIKSGIPLRAFDIMGAGGFLLTNYQSGFLDYFVPEEDFIYYEDKADLVRKVGYYLKHKDERKEIAQNGHDKIAAGHTYRHRVREMLTMDH